ncbi:MAG: 30S ribosomal protein S4, partial [Cyanobacteria bacterium P01_A01_bin.68]
KMRGDGSRVWRSLSSRFGKQKNGFRGSLLDNTIFRLGMAPTIPAARQLVNHGHVTINGKEVNIASYQCRPGEEIGVRNNDKSRKLVEANLQYPGLANLPSHLEFDKNKMMGKVNGLCEREWVALSVNELLVVEYYSRKA